MRNHEKMIFFGNGLTSVVQQYDLMHRLMLAFDLLSGLQQPKMATEQPWTKEEIAQRLAGYREIEDVAADIYCALTGKEPNAQEK